MRSDVYEPYFALDDNGPNMCIVPVSTVFLLPIARLERCSLGVRYLCIFPAVYIAEGNGILNHTTSPFRGGNRTRRLGVTIWQNVRCSLVCREHHRYKQCWAFGKLGTGGCNAKDPRKVLHWGSPLAQDTPSVTSIIIAAGGKLDIFLD